MSEPIVKYKTLLKKKNNRIAIRFLCDTNVKIKSSTISTININQVTFIKLRHFKEKSETLVKNSSRSDGSWYEHF